MIEPDLVTKVAIALFHGYLSHSTWQELQISPLDDGKWCGPFLLDPGHVLAKPSSELMAGIVATGDGYASIDCCSLGGKINAIPLGRFGKKGSDFCDYDGWIVKPLNADIAFFERLPNGWR